MSDCDEVLCKKLKPSSGREELIELKAWEDRYFLHSTCNGQTPPMLQLFFLSPEIQSRVRPSHPPPSYSWMSNKWKADTGGSFGWISWLSGSTELNLLINRLFYDLHSTCLFDFNFNLQPLIPSPLSHCPHITHTHTHTHTEARLRSHPLAFSTDSHAVFIWWLYTCHSLCVKLSYSLLFISFPGV